MYYDSHSGVCKCVFEEDTRLMLITNRTERYTEYEQAKDFFDAGGKWVQLRMKENLNLETATAVVRLTHASDRMVIIDDDIKMAIESCSQGVHLGKKDMPLADAREMLNQNRLSDAPFLIGATANSFEDIRQAVEQGADYIGLGPFRYTDTKKNLSPVLGLEGYQEIIAQCIEENIYIPIFAIGGICLKDVGPLMETGINGIAVSGAIVHAADPRKETRLFLNKINNY